MPHCNHNTAFHRIFSGVRTPEEEVSNHRPTVAQASGTTWGSDGTWDIAANGGSAGRPGLDWSIKRSGEFATRCGGRQVVRTGVQMDQYLGSMAQHRGTRTLGSTSTLMRTSPITIGSCEAGTSGLRNALRCGRTQINTGQKLRGSGHALTAQPARGQSRAVHLFGNLRREPSTREYRGCKEPPFGALTRRSRGSLAMERKPHCDTTQIFRRAATS